MIDNPHPERWQDLQSGVRRILRNVGLQADIEVPLQTPRGQTTVDVYAVDLNSVDNIKYIVECKNWADAIPQSVVHSFSAVMHETGANLGFIIAKHGLQSGAKSYTKNTNITGMTYAEFQKRYFNAWWNRYFCPRVGDAADRVLKYTEEFNPARDEAYRNLPEESKVIFDDLRRKFTVHTWTLSMFNLGSISKRLNTGSLFKTPEDLDDFKARVLSQITPGIEWHCTTFRGLLDLILSFLSDLEAQFNDLFDGYIFEEFNISGVTEEGPPLKEE